MHGSRALCALMFSASIGIPREGFCAGPKEFDGAESRAWLAAKKTTEGGGNDERVTLGGITESVSCSPCRRRSSPGTSMLSGDKVLFFTKPPSVAQARAIRRQWLVNSSQSGGKPRRDRDRGAILLMNYLSGRNNNNVLSSALASVF